MELINLECFLIAYFSKYLLYILTFNYSGKKR